MRRTTLLLLALLAANVAAAGPVPQEDQTKWTEALAKAVRSRDVPAAVRTIEIAAARRLPGAGEAFARAFGSGNAWIRRAALRGIVTGGGAGAAEFLMRALDDPDPLVRLDACVLAGRLPAAEGRTRLADALLGRLSDERHGVRSEAARALGLLRAEAASYSLSEAVRNDRDPTVRSAAVEALGRIGGRDATLTARSALERDEDGRVRANAALALGTLKPSFAVEVIGRALGDTSGRVRAAAAAALAVVGSDDAVKVLVKTLSVPDPDLRREATRALGRTRGEGARGALRGALFHKERGVRIEAAQALGHLGDVASLEGLVKLVRDPDAGVRAAAVEALGRLADPRAAGAIRTSFTDRIPEVRARAAAAAGRVGDLGSLPNLVALTQPKFSDGERVAAAATLGFIGDGRVGAALVAMLDDRSEPVRRAAAAALGRLGVRGDDLLAREARFKGVARIEFLGALAVARVAGARALYEKELGRKNLDDQSRSACEAGLFLLGDGARRAAVVAAARGARGGANVLLAMIALILARDRDAETVLREALRSDDFRFRESAALALGTARPAWAAPLLRERTSDPHLGVRLRARVGLRWVGLRKGP
ncbi:MAG: HEAT repeat domain-containing protein [Planctomycetota bacterium]|jgi:HEAT repeat protein